MRDRQSHAKSHTKQTEQVCILLLLPPGGFFLDEEAGKQPSSSSAAASTSDSSSVTSTSSNIVVKRSDGTTITRVTVSPATSIHGLEQLVAQAEVGGAMHASGWVGVRTRGG